jgi:hypothetical protein
MIKSKRGGFLSFLGGLFLFVIITGVIFEVLLLALSYFYADKVKCNLLWCEFTFKDKLVNESIDTFEFSLDNVTNGNMNNCYINNVEVNCSSIDLSQEKLGINWSNIKT